MNPFPQVVTICRSDLLAIMCAAMRGGFFAQGVYQGHVFTDDELIRSAKMILEAVDGAHEAFVGGDGTGKPLDPIDADGAERIGEAVERELAGSVVSVVVSRSTPEGGGFYSGSKTVNQIMDELGVPRDGKPHALVIRRA